MPERLTVTPLEARIVLFNEIFATPYSEHNRRGHYNEAIARALHGSLYNLWFKPESRSLKPEDIMHDAQRSQLFSERIDEALDTLTDRERVMIRLRFGADGAEIKTLKEVGKEFGLISAERPRQIIVKVMRQLRHPSRSKSLREFLPENQ